MLAFVVGLALAVGPAPAGAQESLGVFPVILEIPDALRGGTFSRTLSVQNFDADLAVTITMEASEDLGDWVRFTDPETGTEDRTTFELGPNEGAEVDIEFAIPADLPNGDYEGQIVVNSFAGEGPDDDGSAVGVGLTVAVQTSLTVSGEEVRDASLRDVQVEAAEVGLPQRFSASVQNAGNVRVEPRVDVTIRRGDDVVTEISSGEAFFRVEPGESANGYVDWDTTEAAAGDYTAEFAVYDIAGRDPVLIGEQTRDFRLEPRGTLTRNADLFDMVVANTPVLGGEAVIQASLSNTGQIEIQAVLDVDVSIDGGPPSSYTSLPQRLGPGGTAVLDVAIPIETAGTYEVVGIVNYDGIETDPLEVSFTADASSESGAADGGSASGSSDGDDDGGAPWGLIGGIAVAVVVIGGAGWFFGLRKPGATGRHAA